MPDMSSNGNQSRSSFGSNGRFRVLFISPSLLEPGTDRGGGCEITDYNVCLQLSKNFEVHLLGPYYSNYVLSKKVNESFFVDYLPFPAQRHYPVHSKWHQLLTTMFLFFPYSLAITARLLRIRPDVVVVHGPQTGLIPVVLARIVGTAVILAEGNITPWYNPNFNPTRASPVQKVWRLANLAMSRFICILATGIRAQSESISLAMIHRGVDPRKIQVISAGQDTPVDERTPKGPADANELFNVAFVGRLVEEKNADLLVDVCKLALSELPETRFHIFGDGPLGRELLGLPNIAHIGKVPREELLRNHLSTIPFVITFQKELGRAEVECLAAGRVIFACNAGEMSRIIRNGENGILCSPEAESYVESIKNLQKNPQRVSLISIGARDTAIRNHNWHDIGVQWTELCCRVLKNKGKSEFAYASEILE